MKLRLVEKRQELPNIYSFFFRPDFQLEWQAGQYLNLTMPEVPPVFADRLFTIASAPHESTLQITTFLTPSPFKQKLMQLEAGDEIEADQLGGDFTYDIPPHVLHRLPEDLVNEPKRLFIAGGIGITPYMSIIRDRLHKNLPINATLLYAGKNEKRPFVDELHAAATSDPSLVVKDYTDIRLNLDQLLKDVPVVKDYIVYLAGSQKFSEDLGEGLVEWGLPRNQIKYDYFDGYTDIEY